MIPATLILGEALDILAGIPDQSVDMIFCDQPFGSTKNPFDEIIPIEPMFEQTRRIIKPNGAIALMGKDVFSGLLMTAHKTGYKHRWIWNKRSAGNYAVAKHMPLTVDEDILIFTANGERPNYMPLMRTGKKRKKGGLSSEKAGRGFGGLPAVYYESDQYYPKSIITCPVVPRAKSRHPNQKPTELAAYFILTYSEPGATVLDFAMGSGSTIEACIRTGRQAIGIEKYPGIFNETVNYLKNPTGRFDMKLIES